MNVKERLTGDLRSALKSKLEDKVGVLRLLLAQIHNREIEKKTSGQVSTLTDSEVVEVLQKEVKKRKEAGELFHKGGRGDLAAKEEKEISIINEYLPPPLSKDYVKKLVAELQKEGHSDFNSLMKEAMKRLKGQADGKTVSEIVKEILG